jgi:hypothetical protein
MKKTLVRIRRSTLAKAILALIIPGGFILWGWYEYHRWVSKTPKIQGKK